MYVNLQGFYSLCFALVVDLIVTSVGKLRRNQQLSRTNEKLRAGAGYSRHLPLSR